MAVSTLSLFSEVDVCSDTSLKLNRLPVIAPSLIATACVG
jgi:hypothetical protein